MKTARPGNLCIFSSQPSRCGVRPREPLTYCRLNTWASLAFLLRRFKELFQDTDRSRDLFKIEWKDLRLTSCFVQTRTRTGRTRRVHSYHYGNTVANHTAIVKGASALLDRVDADARRIFALATIGDIAEEQGHGKATKTFRATYQQYRPLRPPRV